MFQFLMVQLKAQCFTTMRLTLVVSIPYGTIKRNSDRSSNRTTVMFQFLMVQLKDQVGFHRVRTCQAVSIPYGTIKSGSGSWTVMMPSCVSIPYGTIKSPFRYYCVILSFGFNSLWYN